MLDMFYTEDGEYHQAILLNDDEPMVNICIDKIITQPNEADGWEWMIWLTNRTWREPNTTWYGADSSLEAAKLAALDAAVVLADQVRRKTRAKSKVRQPALVD